MKTIDSIDRYVIRRESNVLRVDFHREPDPPALRFPGAGALRHQDPLGESVDAVTPDLCSIGATLLKRLRHLPRLGASRTHSVALPKRAGDGDRVSAP